MRIATVNASIAGGGAERVACSLHAEYLDRGIESYFLAGNVNARCSASIEIPNERYRSVWARGVRRAASAASQRVGHARDGWWYTDRALRLLAEPMRYARVARGHEDFCHPATAHLLELAPFTPDIMHFHNLHGSFFDVRQLPGLTRRVTSVLTMHDVWLLTGHCAYPIECERWLSGCESCAELDRYVPLMADASAANLALKRRALERSQLAIAAPSQWLLDLAGRSGVLDGALDSRVIVNGVDTRIFTPGDRTAARLSLGLPNDAPIVVCAARGLTQSSFKGFDVLEEALKTLGSYGRPALVLALGADQAMRRYGDIKIVFVPFVAEQTKMAQYYQAADIYAHPARAENLPLAILEALACGVPVVAANVGGIPEIVVEGENGLLFTPGDGAQMADCIDRLVDDRSLRRCMGDRAAAIAAERYSISVQADAYLEWYKELQVLHERSSME